MNLTHRPRRLRQNENIRKLVSQHNVHACDLVYPMFITQGESEPIETMPNQYRLSISDAIQKIETLYAHGICGFALFPATPNEKKCDVGTESLNVNNLINTALRRIKKSIPDVILFVDVALDPYTNHGHDGVLDNTGYVENDATVDILVKQAVLQAQNGADVICPSDMMDGRVLAIRKGLDDAGYINTPIMSYAVKYASAFYGPFRDALGSNANLSGDKKTYQMQATNSSEAVQEILLDLEQGADMIMVKPGMPYLDIVAKAKSICNVPVCVYQVSGEYTMIQNMINSGYMKQDAIMESIIAFKRAGADIIFTYFAPQIIDILRGKI